MTYIPPTVTEEPVVDEEAVWAWYQNIPEELASLNLDAEERDSFTAYYQDAGLLTRWRREFFRQHYSHPFCRAANHLQASEGQVILDLGCGTGTQALFFALRGSRVIGVDMDTVALRVFEKRRKNLERIAGRALDVSLLDANVFEVDLSHEGVTGVYSLFAFNMMQPSTQLLGRISDWATDDVRIAILDGNNQSWLPRLVPSRRRDVLSPTQFETELRRSGFSIDAHHGGVGLPPLAWLLPSFLAQPLNRRLCESWLFSVSHLLLASRS